MAVLKCPVCGGELEVNSDLTVGVCKFCDSTIVIPKELDRKGNLYNRAVFLRQSNEFDKAVDTYEDILKEDNSDAEAHWGLVLSKYGIEYVTDPRTNQHVPTCHRTQSESILSDSDYLAALEYSDIEARQIILKEAKRISEIQARILEISRKEPPYDIFICYKESDEFGNRTEDSTLAQELYYELMKKGYKVFFARKTLESKLGTEYEPIIYAALNSAKVMIVLGTKPDNFNAVWVRNEWIRFMRMGRENSFKTIIPAYRGMSPYELPTELSSLQSQDMSKIGFMQDLTDGIERCMHGTKKDERLYDPIVSVSNQLPVERLLKNAETFLKLNNYFEAEEIYKRITKEYPESYKGWWGLIICSTNSLSRVSSSQSDVDTWFDYAKTLCTESKYSLIESQYVDYLRLVAEVDAEVEINRINDIIHSYENNISDEQQSINQKEQVKKSLHTSYEAELLKESRTLSNSQEKLDEAEKNLSTYIEIHRPAFLASGTITGAFWLYILVKQATQMQEPSLSNVIIWVLLLALPIGLFVAAANSQKYRDIVSDAKKEVDMYKRIIANLKKQHQQVLNAQNEEIRRIEEVISENRDKIDSLKQFTIDKREAFVKYYHSIRCAKIGFEVDFNEDISFPSFVSETHYEEKIDIVCPACGSQVTANLGEVRDQRFITCSICGNEIEVENIYSETEMSLELMNEPSSDEKEDEEEYVDMTCPFCDAELSFMRWQIKEGNLRCYVCDRTF